MRQGAVRSFFAVLIGWAALSVGSAHAAVFEAVRSFDPTPESFTRFGCDDYNLGGTISNCWAELGRSGTIFLPSFDAELGDLERVGVQLTLERDVALDFSCGATCNDARSDFNLEFDLYLDHPTILPDGDPLFSLRDSRSLQIPCTVSCMHSYDFDKFAWALFAEDLDRFSTETTEFFRFDWDANDNGTSRAGGPPHFVAKQRIRRGAGALRVHARARARNGDAARIGVAGPGREASLACAGLDERFAAVGA